MFRLQKKQIGLCGILLTLLTLFSFSATPVSAQSTGQWVDKGTISFGGKTYKDGNTSDSSYTFQEQGGSTACVSTSHGVNRLVANGNPYTGAGTQFEFVKVTVQPTEPPCSSSRSTVTVTATENRTKEATGGTGAGTTENPEGAVCITENGLGWIICPLTDLLSKTTTLVADLVEGMLRVDPLPLNPGAATDGSSGIYQVWSGVRNIANIVLVFGFFAIIFSQATSVGISSYGIKKLLPRLVIVSIAINLSYFICALMIDIFNILGAGVAGFFSAANATLPLPAGGETTTGLGSIVGASLATFAVAAGAAFTLGWAIILPALAVAATAFLTAFIVLVFREVAIVILVILSPLAFAAWLLPNTDSYFSKWKGLFTNLLIMYPLVMIIIYGSILTSSIIQTTSSAQDGTIDRIATDIMALLVLALPLFSLPFLLKFAGGIGQRIGAFANNPNRGLVDRARKKRQEVRDNTAYQRTKRERKGRRDMRRTRNYAELMSGGGKYEANEENMSTLKGRAIVAAGSVRRGGAKGVQVTPGGLQDRRRVSANIAEQYRDLTSKETELARQDLEFNDAFNVASEFMLWDEDKKDYSTTNKDGKKYGKEDVLFAMARKGGAKARIVNVSGDAKDFDSTAATGDTNYSKAILKNYAKIGDANPLNQLLHDGEVNQAALRSYIQDNPGATMAKMPDMFKGNRQAFTAPSAAEMSSWHASTVSRMHEFYQQQVEGAASETDPVKRQAFIDQKAKMEQGIANSLKQIDDTPELRSKIAPEAYAALKGFTANPSVVNPSTGGNFAREEYQQRVAVLAGRSGISTPTPASSPSSVPRSEASYSAPTDSAPIPTVVTGGRDFSDTSEGGLYIPHGTPTSQPSAPQPAPQPTPQARPTTPTPPPFTVRQTPTTRQPSPTDTTVPPVERPPRRRDDGGNFGGFA